MAHKDPITGVMVADWGEIFSPADMEEIFESMEMDMRRMRIDLKRRWREIITELLTDDGGINDEWSWEHLYPASLIDVGVNEGFGGSEYWIDYYGVDGKKYRYIEWYSGGSFDEPPDGGADILDLEELRRRKI